MARSRERVSLESGLKLDINHLIRHGYIKPGAYMRSISTWTWTGTGEVTARAYITASMCGDAVDWLSVELFGDGEQRITLTTMPRRFGGVQWYFQCPSTGARCSVLWRPPGARYFASRQAFGRQVAYGTQFETPRDRALTAARKIRRRLGDDFLSCLDGLPPKPKGMRWRTYERLIDDCAALEDFALASVYVHLRRLAS